MLTGPVTILNWSFPREDIPIKDEVLDLEATGVKIIQIDEVALRESCRSVAATGMKTIWTGLFRPSVWSTLPLHRIRRSIPTCATQSLPILSRPLTTWMRMSSPLRPAAPIWKFWMSSRARTSRQKWDLEFTISTLLVYQMKGKSTTPSRPSWPRCRAARSGSILTAV
ncbi:hypothetical protein HMPREF9966_0099 [Streptococcus anginosus SK52 = DSM 20563]|nr:hypothetical protein HMPREF9966_0099 [Streptococcus anginosus SK52 = DSM 20563]BBD41723.1 5-methyltetrahydropteroyltriglutamate-homocysteine S-methyltransferase [Streptococcus anginosus]